MIKVYELCGFDSGVYQTEFLGQKITLTFKKLNSMTSEAQLVSDNPFIQDAIEADERFGNLWFCAQIFDNDVQARAELNKFSRFNPIPDEPEHKPEHKPEVKKEEAPVEEKPKKRASRKKKDVAKTTFANANEAIAYFAEQGVAVTSDEQLKSLLDKNGMTIS